MRLVVPLAMCFALGVPFAAAQTSQSSGATNAAVAIIPQPVTLTPGPGRFQLTPRTVIWTDQASASIGHQLARYLESATGFTLRVQSMGSEVVWTPKERKDFADYLQRLEPHLRRLTALDVSFRPLDK